MNIMSFDKPERIYLLSLAAFLGLILAEPFISTSVSPQIVHPMELIQADAHPIIAAEKNVFVNVDRELARAQQALTEPAPPAVQAMSAPPAASAENAWQLGNIDSAGAAIALPDGVKMYESVALTTDQQAHPSVGQQLALTLPDGSSLVANVETSSTHPNGDYSWSGHLDGYGTDYPVVMTYGSNSVFASITTPGGSYTLESVNGSGWIYKNPSEFELSAAGGRDYLDVPVAQ